MPAYVLFIREAPFTDLDAIEKYREFYRDNPPPPTMTILNTRGPVEAIEGDPVDGIIMLQFPDVAAAKEWYYGKYQESVPYRRQAAPYRGYIIDADGKTHAELVADNN